MQNGQVVGGITDPELFTRWTTMSAFFGWFRNHYDGYNKQYQGPFAYGESAIRGMPTCETEGSPSRPTPIWFGCNKH